VARRVFRRSSAIRSGEGRTVEDATAAEPSESRGRGERRGTRRGGSPLISSVGRRAPRGARCGWRQLRLGPRRLPDGWQAWVLSMVRSRTRVPLTNTAARVPSVTISAGWPAALRRTSQCVGDSLAVTRRCVRFVAAAPVPNNAVPLSTRPTANGARGCLLETSLVEESEAAGVTALIVQVHFIPRFRAGQSAVRGAL
jgi:hypothetical protein